MKLDYIENINTYGENLVRLYSFSSKEATLFKNSIQSNIIDKRNELQLNDLDYIESKNCSLLLRISDEDVGIISDDNISFYCDLTIYGYENMIKLIEPFCVKELKGFQWLYEIDTLTDFLFSPVGSSSTDDLIQ